MSSKDQGMRQLTVRGILIGCLGSVIISATSIYTALKIGALPWPIIFAAIVSLFLLKVLGNTSLNEANVTHTIMSAGAMVGGALAFTIPGIWILGAGDCDMVQMLIVCIAGVVLGLICTAIYHKRFVTDSDIEYPIGQAAAETLIAGDTGGKVGIKLFGSMGIAAVYAFVRDWFGKIPAMLFGGANIPGVAFGIYNSPMLISVGFLVGTGAMLVWFAGAVFGWFGIAFGGSALGFWSSSDGAAISQTLGMGIMMGFGFAVVVKMIASSIKRRIAGRQDNESVVADSKSDSSIMKIFQSKSAIALTTIAVLGIAALCCFYLELGIIASCIVIVIVWAAVAMSIVSVGRTGIDPMEIFGLIVVLIIMLVSDLPQVQLFFIAAIIAIACGLAGDVMNDFKAGKILGTDPAKQWIGQAIGAMVGAIVSAATMILLVTAYGTDAFGVDGSFVAAQANAISSMIAGSCDMRLFALGAAIGFLLYMFNLPVMTLGLGLYLPFYMSLTAFIGAIARIFYDRYQKHKGTAEGSAESTTGTIIASGLLGGESIAGIIVAFCVLFTSL